MLKFCNHSFFIFILLFVFSCNQQDVFVSSAPVQEKSKDKDSSSTSAESVEPSVSSQIPISDDATVSQSDETHLSVKILPPHNGVYHGANPDFGGTEDVVTADAINAFETLAGKPIVWGYFSNNWMQEINYVWLPVIEFPSVQVDLLNQMGKIPFIRMMARSQWAISGGDPEYTMARIINGDFDDDLILWALEAKATQIPLMVEFGAEANGSWFPWNGLWNGGSYQTGYGDPNLADGPERFRDAYRHIIDLFRAQAVHNITWVFHADAFSYPDRPWNRSAHYYPGDDYIDWIGISLYGPQFVGEGWYDLFGDMLNDVYSEVAAISSHKPIAILEFGIADDPTYSKATWIQEALAVIASGAYPRIKAISYWNESWVETTGETYNLRINSSPSALQAYQLGIAHAAFVSEPVYSTSVNPNTLALFTNDFSQSTRGTYTLNSLSQEWNHPAWNNGVSQNRVSIISSAQETERGSVMQVFYPQGGYGPQMGGAQWKMDLDDTHTELYVSYKVKFGAGFDFVKGGKLPGLAGGTANTGADVPDGTDGWSARVMWRTGGRMLQYIYHPDQPESYGEDFDWNSSGDIYLTPGVWYTIKTRVVMNTPGLHDGIIQTWLDDNLVLDVAHMRYRDVDTLGIDVFYLSTFFGGGDSSWAANQNESIFFDDFVISDQAF